jgi:DNA polymerase
VGASGRVLSELLGSVGLKREDIYITNVVKDRPPENRDPTEVELALYRPFLVEQIDIIRPSVVATLGRFAMGFVFDLFQVESAAVPKISDVHGKLFQGQASYGPVAVVPLFHPAVALYSTPRKATLLEDFQVLKQFVE